MIETTRPMSQGRAPTGVGNVAIISDGGYYPSVITNREISFPDPASVNGYLADGYGVDLALVDPLFYIVNGSVWMQTDGEDTRSVTTATDYYEYHTPKFKVYNSQGDVVNRPWDGVVITMSNELTTEVWEYVYGSPGTLISTTTTTQSFTYTFSSADDPDTSSPYFLTPNQMLQTGLLGTEYLYYSYVYTSLGPPSVLEITLTTQTPWVITATTPP